YIFFFQAEDGIRDFHVTGVQTCALPILNIFQIRDPHLKTKIYHIIQINSVENLFIHYLDSFKAGISNKILNSFPLKSYWIFYGRSEERRVGKECRSRR